MDSDQDQEVQEVSADPAWAAFPDRGQGAAASGGRLPHHRHRVMDADAAAVAAGVVSHHLCW